MNKSETIKSITQRIKDEFRKHPKLDWAEIAARKIYSSHIGKSKQELKQKITNLENRIQRVIDKLNTV